MRHTFLSFIFLLLPVVMLSAQEQGSFCGAVGSVDCDAIAADSSAIVAWATGCTVVRGPADITHPEGPFVHYGDESMGIGPAGVITTAAVSLGDGGTATLTFALPIRDGEGPDFAVFENPFNDNFLELAFVEVSSDGEHYVRFPATSLTPTDMQVSPTGSVDPTQIHNLAGKYRVGYGTPFDLATLRDSSGINIDSIVYVRVVDVVGTIDPEYGSRDAYGHIVNDPYPTSDMIYGSGGFDLTGVAVLHQQTPAGIPSAPAVVERLWPNPATDQIHIDCRKNGVTAQLFSIDGTLVSSCRLQIGGNSISLSALVPGIYLLRTEGSCHKVVKR